MLVCKVCNSEFKYSGPRGPKYKATTCSKECRYKLVGSLAAERRVHPLITTNCEICHKEITSTTGSVACSKECHAKRLSNLYAGRKLTDEWKSNQNKSKVREKIVRYGQFSCEKCQKSFDTNLSLRAHRSYCTPDLQSGRFPCATCGKVFKSDRGLKIHSHCHNKDWNDSKKEKLRIKAQNRVSQRTSKKELVFFEKLKDFFGESEVIHKFKFSGCSHEYDFFIPSKNLIVEFDGDYWHGNKSLHTLTPRMKKQYWLDRTWDEKAASAGYNIKRVWESEMEEFNLETL